MKKYLPAVFFSTLFVLLLFFLNNRNSLNFVENNDEIISKPTPTPTEVQWQTYRNEKYGFEFQYPSDMNIIIGPYKDKNTILITKDTKETVSPGGWSGVFINVLPNNSKIDSKTFVQKEMLKDKLNANVVIKKENIIDIDATTTNGEIVQGNGDSTPKTYISKDKYIFVISANIQNYISLYTQILSTFKLLPDTSTWKTYKNTQYGFEFKYPSSWKEVKADFADFTISDSKNNCQFSFDLSNRMKVTLPINLWVNKQSKSNQECTNCPGIFVGDVNKTPTIIDNIKTISYLSGNEGGTSTTYLFTRNNKIYNLNTYVSTYEVEVSDDEIKKCEQDLNQILSTFKFTK